VKTSVLARLIVPFGLLAVQAVPMRADEAAVEIPTPTAVSRATKKVMPAYPIVALQLHLTGQLDVAITVNADGDVEDASVVKGNVIFSPSALTAVKQWKFLPLQKDGKPARMATVLTFSFHPQGN
jgi:TonB family protein